MTLNAVVLDSGPGSVLWVPKSNVIGDLEPASIADHGLQSRTFCRCWRPESLERSVWGVDPSAPPAANSSHLWNVLARLGEWPVLQLGLMYTLATCVGAMVSRLGTTLRLPGLDELGTVARLAAGLMLYLVVTWHRDDDALEAGVLLGASLFAGNVLANALRVLIFDGSLSSAIGVFAMSPIVFLLKGRILIVPCSIAMVWLGRDFFALQRSARPTESQPVPRRRFRWPPM